MMRSPDQITEQAIEETVNSRNHFINVIQEHSSGKEQSQIELGEMKQEVQEMQFALERSQKQVLDLNA